MELKNFDFYYTKENIDLKSVKDFVALNTQKTTLPSDIALLVSNHKNEDALHFSTNVTDLQKSEDLYCYYFCEFALDDGEYNVVFDRIDVYSEIYINGVKELETDNAFISFEKQVRLKKHNELVIKILPAKLVAAKKELPSNCWFMEYNFACAYMRKPMYMHGWDIFPRNILGGIYAPVKIEKVEQEYIKSTYFYTAEFINNMEKAAVIFRYALKLNDLNNLDKYSIELIGECKDSKVYTKRRLWFVEGIERIFIDKPYLWNVLGTGEQNLYKFTTNLYYEDKLIDTKVVRTGLRIVRLDRKNGTDGRFDFYVNGKKVFIKGTNHVPVSILHNNETERLKKEVDLLVDLNCNMIRVWGGGQYESEEFYNLLDEKGILVWQDFMMACGIYPWDDDFCSTMKKEGDYIVKKLHNHPSIVLWCGDNECDSLSYEHDESINPNDNPITRKALYSSAKIHNQSSIYLPSSPYYDQEVILNKISPSEKHLWGAKDYFKSDFYVKNLENTAFVSEIGYFALPNYESLAKFISEENLENPFSNDYLLHNGASNPETDRSYTCRMRKTVDNAKMIFNEDYDSFRECCLLTQITQAEALKFFVEKMRAHKDKKGGILFWNLIDGWPQISDAVVDYYYQKKLAYDYIKRVYADFTMIFEENGDKLDLYAVNDKFCSGLLNYQIIDAETQEIVESNKTTVNENCSQKIFSFEYKKSGFYIVKWEFNGENGFNHFVCNIKNYDKNKYYKLAEQYNLLNLNSFLEKGAYEK